MGLISGVTLSNNVKHTAGLLSLWDVTTTCSTKATSWSRFFTSSFVKVQVSIRHQCASMNKNTFDKSLWLLRNPTQFSKTPSSTSMHTSSITTVKPWFSCSYLFVLPYVSHYSLTSKQQEHRIGILKQERYYRGYLSAWYGDSRQILWFQPDHNVIPTLLYCPFDAIILKKSI